MSILTAAGMLYLVHYIVYCIPQPFFIEDAAISFAYAKNLVAGEGLVTYPGGERVEGYSNGLWVFVNAFVHFFGVPLWTSAKVLGCVFGLATLPIVFGLMRLMRPNGRGDVALLAPAMLAVSPQFVIWNASGLENSLFCFLLAFGCLRLVKESTHRCFPWSAVLFALLTMTRPEGLMYAVIALFARVLYCAADRRLLPLLTWVGVFLVPWGLYNGWRYWYFAWEWPNTYYAKLGSGRTFRPFSWTSHGWKYINAYFVSHGLFLGIPLLLLATVGVLRWRLRLIVGWLAVLSVLIGWNGILPGAPTWWQPVQDIWVELRVWTIAASAALMGVLVLGRPGWRARGLLWTCCAASVFFALYAGGDWMDAHRWFNVVVLSMLPLMAVGLGVLADTIGKNRAWVLGVPIVAFGVGEVINTTRFAIFPETSVRDIHRRVMYMSWVQERLDLDHVTLLDVDMGAHMFFSGWNIVDIAGLVDVPMARHWGYNKKFIAEYIFEERRPEFAHVHGYWANKSKIPRHKEWRQQYLEIAHYPISGRRLHVGNHIRKDLLVQPRTDQVQVAQFDERLSMRFWDVPSPEVAAGGTIHLRTAWWARQRPHPEFRVMVWLDNGIGNRAVVATHPGFGWYPIEDWKRNEAVLGTFEIPVPEDLPAGEYAMGVVVISSATGAVLPASEPDSTWLPGGWRSPTTVLVVSPESARDHAESDRTAALSLLLDGGDCEAGWQQWKAATRHEDAAWRDGHESEMRSATAACWVTHANSVSERAAKIAALIEARRWDHRLDEVVSAAAPLAEALDAEGTAMWAVDDWEGAYQSWRTALALDPRRSWTRRRAEAARDLRLEIETP